MDGRSHPHQSESLLSISGLRCIKVHQNLFPRFATLICKPTDNTAQSYLGKKKPIVSYFHHVSSCVFAYVSNYRVVYGCCIEYTCQLFVTRWYFMHVNIACTPKWMSIRLVRPIQKTWEAFFMLSTTCHGLFWGHPKNKQWCTGLILLISAWFIVFDKVIIWLLALLHKYSLLLPL